MAGTSKVGGRERALTLASSVDAGERALARVRSRGTVATFASVPDDEDRRVQSLWKIQYDFYTGVCGYCLRGVEGMIARERSVFII